MIAEFQVGLQVRIDGHAYNIERQMVGGMGLVLLCAAARPTGSYLYPDRLATKVFGPDCDQRQVRTELRIWQGLSHPNIVPLLAVGHVNDWLCATMPWFDRGAVSANGFRSNGGLAAVQSMLAQVVSALSYAYARRLLHLDIKPANILWRTGNFGLADWGIAKTSSRLALQMDENSGGTLPYMAPERFTENKTTEMVDVFSLGMTAGELLTGSLPFNERSERDLVKTIVSGHYYGRLQIMTQTVPDQWRSLILKCCSYDPKDRPSDYKKLAQLIEKLET